MNDRIRKDGKAQTPPPYDPPRAVRMDDWHGAEGISVCSSTGSSAGSCQTGNNASAGCSTGNGAI